MCQGAVKRLCNHSKSYHVRKVARLLAQALSAFPEICSMDPAYPASYGKALGALLAAGHARRFIRSIAPHGPGLNRVGSSATRLAGQESAISAVSRSVSDQELYKTFPAHQLR